MPTTPTPEPLPERKIDNKRKSTSRLRRVGRRLLFRKGSTSPSTGRVDSSTRPSSSSYGALQETERWHNRRTNRGGDDDDEDVSLSSLPSLQHRQDEDDEEEEKDDAPRWMFWHSNRSDMRLISNVEMYLRWIILLTGSFMLGVHFASLAAVVEKSLEYAAVAWITCVSLGILLATSSYCPQENRRGRNRLAARRVGMMNSSFDEEEGRPLLSLAEAHSSELGGDLSDHGNNNSKSELFVPEDATQSTGNDDSGYQSSGQFVKQVNVHPALEPYFVVDSHKVDRVLPNSDAMYKMDTDYFSGDMMVLIRTPDVDDATLPSPAANASAVQHLRSKQRRFEFQFQVKLKKVPTGTVYFSCDLTQKINLGMVQRAFVSAAMSFVRSSNPSFHYSIQGSTPNDDGTYERPHMAFPVQDGMNRVVATPPGQVCIPNFVVDTFFFVSKISHPYRDRNRHAWEPSLKKTPSR